jgi:phosphatidylglycerophosphatase A
MSKPGPSDESSAKKKKMTPAVWLATGLGVGLVTRAPGTVGGLWGIPLALAILQFPSVWMQIAVIGVICMAGIPLCSHAVADLGGKKDPGSIVFDEIASVPIVFLFLPAQRIASGSISQAWLTVAIGYALHRFFDILKPPPTRRLERLPSGLGIMADDWMAGIYACLVLNALMWAWPV